MKDKQSITVHFTPGPIAAMLEQIAAGYAASASIPVRTEHNCIPVPKTLGSGFVACRELFDGMYCLVCDVNYHLPALVVRRPCTDERYYVLGCRYGYPQPYFTDSGPPGEDMRINSDSIFVHSSQLGSSLLFPAGQRHRTFTIIISREFALEELRLIEHPPRHPLVQDFINDHPFSNITPLPLVVRHHMDQVFEQLGADQHADFILRTSMVSAAYYLMNQWYYHCFAAGTQQRPYYHTNLHDVLKVKDLYVRDFESPPLTVEELARMCNMSVTKFKSVFKSLFGMSCYQYYQAQRMEYARQLLSQQQYPVKEVAYMTGFQNTANFTRSFKKAFDTLPRDLQRAARERAR
ncbi:helix-turn-helix transcriptional regulator [Chitinophaga japonensis]|uniref:AraC-like DNA-binding protein n=1 Tax=Chitinophaga japonensis TaxID=104662 RepID=A0A562T0V6_CHIJA|nr:AraC family transcriptional regulator [Chitinophaga japonensis]TWI86953.1 AraC-like DNA-binding protein [Chitinophaga japonensis]